MSMMEYAPESIRKSYLRKFLVASLIVVFLVAGIGVFTQSAVSEQITDQRQTDLMTNTELESNLVGQWSTNQKETTRTLSQHQALASGEASSARQMLQDELDHSASEVAGLHYVNVETQTIEASTSAENEGKKLTTLNIIWPREQSFEELGLESPESVVQSWVYADAGDPTSTDTGTPSIAYVSPVPGTDYALVRVIRTNKRAEQFRSSIEGTRTVVMGRNTGRVLFDRNKSKVLKQYAGPAGSTITERVGDNPNGTLVTDSAVIAYTTVPSEPNLIVIKSAPKSEALALRGEVRTNIVLLIGGALFGLVALGGMVSRGPMRAIEDLSKQARDIAEGDLSGTIEGDRVDEVGQAQDAFRDIQAYLTVVAEQADALARQEFDNEVLDERVPGSLGESLNRMQADLEQFIDELEQAREDAEQSREEAQQLADSLESQAEQFSEVMTNVADGDLTQRLDTDTENEAMQDIARQCNEMLAELERTVVRIDEFADQVDTASETAAASAQEIKATSEQVSESVQMISEGTEEQSESIEQVTDEMTSLSASIEEVASSASEVAEKSRSAAQAGEDGRESATAAADEMETIQQKTDETIREIEALDAEMERISEVVELIDEIADQTNMLALNASIEAANADGSGNSSSSGEGFAVVADEIKTLASETQDATNEIEEMILDIQDSTGRAVEDMREMGTRVDSGRETVTNATESLEDIVEKVTAANDGIQPISDAADDQAASTEEVVAMADEVRSISEDTATQAENAAAAAEEQTAAVTEVTQTVERLSENASELKTLVNEFDTDGDT